MPPRRYREFDGLRGLLALWVALAHVFCWCGYGHVETGGPLVARAWAVFTGADAAAETFIILSGFAIATLLQREQVSYGRYMLRRVFRIYPVYIVSLLVCLWMAPATGLIIDGVSWAGDYYLGWQRESQANLEANWEGHLWAHVVLLHALIPAPVLKGSAATLLMPAWSIGLEEQFYLVAPLLLWLLCRPWGLVTVLVTAVLGQVLQGVWSNPMNATLPYWLPFFLVGIGSSYVAGWLERDAVSRVRWGGGIAFFVLVAAMFLAREPLPFLIWGAACTAAMGLWTDFARKAAGAGLWLLRARWTQWVGDISYSLYLMHWPLIIMLLGVLHRLHPGLPKHEVIGLMLAVGMPVILLLSWALHRWVEKPFMALGRRLARPAGEGGPLPVLPAIP